MIAISYRYPNDPSTMAVLMFGAEFNRYVRGDQPAQILVNGEPAGEPFTEIICDTCNGEVRPLDPCCYVPELARVYCHACADEWVRPHFEPNTLTVVTNGRRI